VTARTAPPARLHGARSVWLDPVVLAAVAVATLLRLWGLGSQSFWYDEWLTARAAEGTVGNLYRYVTEQAGIPPPFFVLEWLWARVFGTSEASLRCLPLLAGVATVAVVAWAASVWGANRTGVRLVAVLAATNPMLVWYSQEARPYSVVALLTGASLIPLRRWVVEGRRSQLGWWGFLAALVVAFHYYAIFVVLLEGLYVLARRRPERRDLVALLPAALVAVALLPFALDQTGRRENHRWIADWSLALRLRELRSSAITGPGVAGGSLLTIGTVAAVVLLGAMAAAWSDRSARRLLVVAGFGLGAVAAAWVTALIAVDGVVSRYFIGAVVVLIVGAAAATCTRHTARVAVVAGAALAVAGVGGVSTVQRDQHAQRQDWQAVADAVGHRSDGGSAILVVDRGSIIARPLTWYLPGRPVVGAGERTPVTDIYLLQLRDDDAACNWLVGLPCEYLFVGNRLHDDLARTFSEVERVPAGPFVLVHYRTAQPRDIGPEDFTGYDTPDLPLLIVVTPPA
jgi:uncharacterized membrane protein